jgi:starvation-inducible DNA-binding protein
MTYSVPFDDQQIPVHSQEIAFITGADVKPKATVGDLISQLVALSSYINQLYVQVHLIHLNIEGPNFLALHKFLNKQYEDHIEQFDQLAEFVRSMDYMMPMCGRGLASAYKGFKHVKSYSAEEMLTTYEKNLEACGMMAKDLGTTAGEAEAPDVENYAADLVGAMFKAAWFLKATLRD